MVIRPKITQNSKEIEKKILCFLHFRYSRSENVIFTFNELKDVILEINSRILKFAINQLQETEYLSTEEVVENGFEIDGYSITSDGIKWVDGWDDEQYELASIGVDFLEDNDGTSSGYNQPDTSTAISAKAIDECRGYISKALIAIANGDFDQDEKAQIRGLLKICDDILELPTPKISILRRVLGMLRGIKEIEGYVKSISNFLDTLS